MSLFIRCALLAGALITFFWIVRKLRKAQLHVWDTVIWLGLSLIFLLLSIVPEVAITLANYMGVQSPINLVFLVVIFILLIQSFINSIRITMLENKIRELSQEIAIREMKRGMMD